MGNKIKLPMKTKIAVWWIIILAFLEIALVVWTFCLSVREEMNPGCGADCSPNGLCLEVLYMAPQSFEDAVFHNLPSLYSLILPFLLLLFSYKTISGRGWSWIAILFFLLLPGIALFLFSVFIIFFEHKKPDLIPFLFSITLLISASLLLVDYKNYFAAVEGANKSGLK